MHCWHLNLTQRLLVSLTLHLRLFSTTAALICKQSIYKVVHMHLKSHSQWTNCFSLQSTAVFHSIRSFQSKTNLDLHLNTSGRFQKNMLMKSVYSQSKLCCYLTKFKTFLQHLLHSKRKIMKSQCLLSLKTYLSMLNMKLGFSILVQVYY